MHQQNDTDDIDDGVDDDLCLDAGFSVEDTCDEYQAGEQICESRSDE
jgi:hypothetical protein